MTETNEIWRPVKGYEGLYEVSNLGRVKSLKRVDSIGRIKGDKVLKNSKGSKGYFVVSLYKERKQKISTIHRLVAEAFIPNPDNKPCIDHIDTDKTNNVVWLNQDGSVNYDKTNLRWCTTKENSNNPLTKKKVGEIMENIFSNSIIRKKMSKVIKEKWQNPIYRDKQKNPVIQLSKNGVAINYFAGQKDASEQTGISNKCISLCCTKKNKTAGGYRWLSFEDYEQYY